MDENIALADLQQLFLGTVVLYKNRPVKVLSITDLFTFKVIDLLSQKTENLKNPLRDLQPPLRRLGMVNIGGGCIYVRRTPARKWTMGVNSQNVQFSSLSFFSEEGGMQGARDKLQKMDCIELGECLFNRYPTFKQAVEEVDEFAGTMAFDKQFAIDTEYRVWYRDKHVGTYAPPARKKPSVEYINWKANHEYLINLIGDFNEKDLSSFRQSC